jgi:hypothetical protein
MKTLTRLLLLGALVTATTSCEKFLDEDPKSFISEDQYYKTQADALTAVNAVYFLLNAGGSTIQTPYNTLFNTGMNFAGDDEDPGPGATNPDVRSLSVLAHSSSNLRVYELWQQHYAAIKKANVALEKIPAIEFDAALKSRLLAEAKFLRALYYFNLVRLYGDVPLIITNQSYVQTADYAVARTPSAEVYAQIEKDLTEAAAVLPAKYGSSDAGRATAGAAKALLAKVYLTKASLPLNLTVNYQKAVQQAEEALSPADGGTGTYGYDLFPNYADVFLPASKNGREHIFSAQFKSNSLGQGNYQNPRSIFTGIPGLTGLYTDQVRFYKKGDDKFFSVFKLYKPADKRRKVTFVTKFVSPTNGKKYGLPITNNTAVPGDSTPFFNKAWDPGSVAVTGESAANVAIIRYAELLLIHAEAENEANGPTEKAYRSLNRVRNRAGLPNLTAGLSQDQFRDSLYLDRRLELVFEYQRWFDLIRQKDGSGSTFVRNLHAVGKTNAKDFHRLYPIPQNELNVNPKLTQNPNW